MFKLREFAFPLKLLRDELNPFRNTYFLISILQHEKVGKHLFNNFDEKQFGSKTNYLFKIENYNGKFYLQSYVIFLDIVFHF